ANDAFLRMIGYDREDLVAGRVHRRNLTPPEWCDRDERTMTEVKMIGTVQPFEKEYLRKDGNRVPVMIGLTSFKKGGKQGVAFVLDLTERKRAEAEARESERRLADLRMEFAHTARVSLLGELTASIAHEINQPLAAVLTNSKAGLRWLDRAEPNVTEAR